MIDVSAHGGMYGGVHLKGRRLINFYIQLSEPTDKKTGDVWIKTDEVLGDIIVNDKAPVNPTDKLVWQKVDRLDYSIKLDEVEAFVRNDKERLEVAVNSQAFLSSIPSNKRALWENIYMKVFGNPEQAFKYDGQLGYFTRVEAFTWDGVAWVQTSFLMEFIYYEGTSYIDMSIEAFKGSNISYESDHFVINVPEFDAMAIATSIKKVDVTDLNTLRIDISSAVYANGSSREVYFGLSRFEGRNGHDWTSPSIFDVSKNIHSYSTIARGIHELDISNVSGEFFVKTSAFHRGVNERYNLPFNIYGLWLE